MSQNLRSTCSESFFFMNSKNSFGVIGPVLFVGLDRAQARMRIRHGCTKFVHLRPLGAGRRGRKALICPARDARRSAGERVSQRPCRAVADCVAAYSEPGRPANDGRVISQSIE